jgi:hypothetical protein
VGLEVAKSWNPSIQYEKAQRTLALHFALRDSAWTSTSSFTVVVQYLHAWCAYASDVMMIANESRPSGSPTTQMLLGLRPPSSDSNSRHCMSVLEDSFIFGAAQRDQNLISSNDNGENLILAKTVDSIIATELVTRLHDRLRALHIDIFHSVWTQPCGFESHNSPESSAEPLTRVTTSDDQFMPRLRVVTLAIITLHRIRRTIPTHMQCNVAELWIRRLFDIICPSTGGEEDTNSISRLPDCELLRKTIMADLHEDLTLLHPPRYTPNSFFTILICNLKLIALLDPQTLHAYAAPGHSFKHYSEFTFRHGCSTRAESMAMDLVQFFRGKYPESLTRAVYALQ